VMHLTVAGAYAQVGNLDAARRHFEDAAGYEVYTSEAMVLLQDWDSAQAQVEGILDNFRARGVRSQIGHSALFLGFLLRCRGDLEGAVKALEFGVAESAECGFGREELTNSLEIAITLAEQGHPEDAAPHAERAREIMADGQDWLGLVHQLAFADAAIAAARGDMASAGALFESALTGYRHFELPWHEAEARLLWGRALLDAGQRGSALEQLDAALAIYRRIGAGAQWLERVLAVKMRAQGSSSSHVKASIQLVAASVEAKRPSMSMAVGEDGTVTLMFSDMYDYTGMMERLGDRKALNVVEDHNAIVRTQCEAHGGFEVELRGDGFLVAFPTPQSGVRCGIALQQAFAEFSRTHTDEPLSVRIGLHTGEAIRDADKFFGKTVIHAFRVADLAKSEEILISGDVKAAIADRGTFRIEDERNVTLKGFSGQHPIARVEWR
jgi:class 3 adenylate cyclase